jgi:hypothetical protein
LYRETVQYTELRPGNAFMEHQMATRSGSTRTKGGKATRAARAAVESTIEQRLVALAEELGRVAGTVQSRAEHWTDRDLLSAQLASVRDAASGLLVQMAARAKKGAQASTKEAAPPAAVKKPSAKRSAARKSAPKTLAGAVTRRTSEGRSGGVVDAPGKKHRKPLPSDPGATIVDSQAAKMRTSMPMAKTRRLRGRG